MYYSDKRIVHKMMQQNINSILIDGIAVRKVPKVQHPTSAMVGEISPVWALDPETDGSIQVTGKNP